MDEIAKLIQNLRSGKDTQRRAAAYRLGQSKNPMAVIPLIWAYNDSDSSVRLNVVAGLRNIGGKVALEFLALPNNVQVKVSQHVRESNSMPSLEDISSFMKNIAQLHMLASPSHEAIKCYEKAMDLWGESTIGELDDNKKRDIAALLALAIKKANTPYPLAESRLGLFLYMMGDVQTALTHANLALRYEPDSFTGQLVRVFNALDSIKVKKLGVGDFIDGSGGSIEGAIFGSVFKGLFSVAGAGIAATTQTSCKDEIYKLVEIYRRISPSITDVNEFMQYAELLVGLGDYIKDIPFSGGRPNLFIEVVNASISQLEMNGRDDDIDDIRLKAEGKSELFKP